MAMARAARQRGRAKVAEIELLESRSVLSNLGLGFSVSGSVDTASGNGAEFGDAYLSISPEVAVPETVLPNQIGALAPRSAGLSISVVAPSPATWAPGNEASSDTLVIEIGGLGIQSPAVEGSVYLEDGWIVIELPITPLEAQTPAA